MADRCLSNYEASEVLESGMVEKVPGKNLSTCGSHHIFFKTRIWITLNIIFNYITILSSEITSSMMAKSSFNGELLSVKKVTELLSDMYSLISDSMGPNGKAVMISIHSPKQIVVTKNGLDILEAIRCRHPNQAPLVNKIIDRLASHVFQYGDGTKRIVFMLYHFWRAITNQRGHGGPSFSGTSSEVKWRLEILAQVRQFRHYTFPLLVQNNFQGFQEKKNSASRDLEDVLHRIVIAFMSTRFPSASALTLSDLLFNQYIKPNLEVAKNNQKQQNKAIRNSLIEMSQQFASKVILGLNQPISCSKVLPPGVFLSQPFACVPKVESATSNGNILTNSRFIIWALEETEDTSEDIVIREGSLSDVSAWKFLKWKAQTFRGFLLKLKSFEVKLIISVSGLKDYEKSICQQLDMAVIEYVDRAEANNIASEANILILTGSACDNIEAFNEHFVSKPCIFAKEVRLGRHFYSQLLLQNNKAAIVTKNKGHHHELSSLQHVLVCGMTQSSAEQYSKALDQCLRLLAKSTLNGNDDEKEAIAFTSFLASRPASSKQLPNSFEVNLIKGLDSHLLTSNSKERDVLLALRKALETLVQEAAIGSKNEAEPATVPYPLEAAVEQINVVLDITEMLLRIERMCFVRKRIQDVLLVAEDNIE